MVDAVRWGTCSFDAATIAPVSPSNANVRLGGLGGGRRGRDRRRRRGRRRGRGRRGGGGGGDEQRDGRRDGRREAGEGPGPDRAGRWHRSSRLSAPADRSGHTCRRDGGFRSGVTPRGVPRWGRDPRFPSLSSHRVHRRVGHAGRRRQGQGAEGGRRERHRIRRRRARLPDARAHRRGGGRRLPRPANHRYTPDGRAAGAARRRSPTRPPRLGLRRSRPGQVARHQRRQARGLQHLPGAAATRATRCSCPRRTGPPTPRRSRSRGGVPVVLPTDEADGFRVTVDQLEAARTAAHQGRCCSCRRRTRPARSTRPRRSRRSAGGRSSTASGSSPTRSTSTSPTATTSSRSMPALVPELADTLRGAQRRGQDLRDDRLAGRLDDRPDRRHHGGHQPPVALDVERRRTSRSGPRSPRCRGDLDAVAEMRAAFERRGKTMHELLERHPGRHVPRAPGRVLLLPVLRGRARPRRSRAARRRPRSSSADVLLDEAKVAIVPGEAFGAPGLRPPVVRARRRRPRRGRRPHRRVPRLTTPKELS